VQDWRRQGRPAGESVAYTVLFSQIECLRACAFCGQLRTPGARLRPDGPASETIVVVCGACVSPDWVPGKHVDAKEFEEVRRLRGF
jgi:hypothetical protein